MATHKARIYKGYEIFHCDQTDLGRCDYKGWHTQSFHSPTGLPYAEEYCPKFWTLKDAREWIDTCIAHDEISGQ